AELGLNTNLDAVMEVDTDISLAPIHWRYTSVNWAAVRNANLIDPAKFGERVKAGLGPLTEVFDHIGDWFSSSKEASKAEAEDNLSAILSDDPSEAFSQEYKELIEAGVLAEEAEQMLSNPLIQDILAYQKAETVLAAYWSSNIPEGDYETMAMTGSMPVIVNGQLYFVGGAEASWESTLGGKPVWHKFAPARFEDGKIVSGRHVILCDPMDFPNRPDTALQVKAHEQSQLTQWVYENILKMAEDAANIMEEYPKAREVLLFAGSSILTGGPLGGLLKKGLLQAIKQVGKGALQGELAEAGARLLVEQGEKRFGWEPENRDRNEALLTLAFGLVDGSKDVVKNGLKKFAQVRKGGRVRPVNDRFPINHEYAGKLYPLEKLPKELREKYSHSIPFSGAGFPDFSRYAKHKIRIKFSGDSNRDIRLSNKLLSYKKTPEGYTWHHHYDGETMMLVPKELHDAVRHTGGNALTKLKNS
ncbi:MAG: HNH endonuclease, partial [Alphaproteobacteria bacterium]|nr:HNH endonuclease [Alphaproteobacteria bacterium]